MDNNYIKNYNILLLLQGKGTQPHDSNETVNESIR